jgi:hypothetical protein
MPAFESCAAAAGGALALLFGGYVAATSARRLRRVWASRRWVETPCEVESIRAVGVEDYGVEIAFAYAVGGTAYRSDRFSLVDHLVVNDAHGYVARHPPGSRAVCYVNPADPADAVFVRSVNVGLGAVMVALGVLVAGAGAYVAWLGATGRPVG